MISEAKASKKILIKVDRGGDTAWVHLCYVNGEILETFLKIANTSRRNMKKWLTKWAEEDFCWDIDFTEYSHIQLLKELVIDRYKRLYPHLYYNNAVDNHGWMRCWVSEKMGKEILRHDKAAYNRLFNASTNYGGRL